MACKLITGGRATLYTVSKVFINIEKSSNKQPGDLQTASPGLSGGHYSGDEQSVLTLERASINTGAEESEPRSVSVQRASPGGRQP